ncbi:MAG TPA: hypothetical protein VGL21_15770 [Jatrophihabitantaceae bacterium]
MTGSQQPEPELGEIEWLDGGRPGDPVGAGRPPSQIPRAVWYTLVVVVLAAVVIAVTVSRHHSKPRAASAATPSRTPPTPTPSTTNHPIPPSRVPLVTVRDLGHPLLNVPRGVDLFTSGGDSLLRIELASGRITRTAGVGLSSGAPTSLVAGPHQVMLKSFDNVPGFLIPDGRPARPLPGGLARGTAIYPGPDPVHFWVSDQPGSYQARSELVGVDGRPTGTTLPLGASGSDGAGYLLTEGIGGVYDVRPGSVQRVTSGALLAVGPTRLLTLECDPHYRCTLDAVDRATGVHHVLRPASTAGGGTGTISPDGRTAAVSSIGPAGTTVHLVNLTTGADRSTSVQADSSGSTTMVWTPDSHWLLVVDTTGHIVAIDHNGHARILISGETPITAITLRAE